MDRRTSEDLSNYSREVGTERRALRARGDRRRHSPAFRIFFIPLSQLVHKLRTRSLSF
ncbi:MAG TPA: hypothetical protein VGK03_00530 [Geothrix sp.]|jgi:hypothetical protein